MTVALSRRWALMSSSPPTVAKKYSAGALVGAKDGTLLRLPIGCVGVPKLWWRKQVLVVRLHQCGDWRYSDRTVRRVPY